MFRRLLPRVEVERRIMKELQQRAVAEAVVVQVQLPGQVSRARQCDSDGKPHVCVQVPATLAAAAFTAVSAWQLNMEAQPPSSPRWASEDTLLVVRHPYQSMTATCQPCALLPVPLRTSMGLIHTGM